MARVTARDSRIGTTHLRRLTRAHAAGEMSTEDYRRRRRAFIEACALPEPSGSEDKTVPRVLPARAVATSAPEAGVERGRRGRSVWLWVMPLTVALLVILGVSLPG
jgi:hypothetical protein